MKKYLLFFFLLLPGITSKCIAAINVAITGSFVPPSMYSGETYTISIYLQNSGTTATPSSFIVNVSINSGNTYDGSQTWLADVTVTGAISPSGTRTVTASITIPCSYGTGTKYILLYANPVTHSFTESSYTDNIWAPSALIRAAPDLAPLNYSLSTSSINAGSSLTAYFSVNDIGSLGAGSFNVGFYLSASSTLVLSSSVYLGGYSASASGCTCSSVLNKSLTIPTLTCTGTYYLFVFIDDDTIISESDETNNFQFQTLSISGETPSSPPTSASASPSSIISGNSSSLTVSGGSLGTGASWKWYPGSCGGTSLGSGTSVTVSPTVTTTYYVRAEGCNTTVCTNTAVSVACASVSVTSQPTNQTITSGSTASFSTSVSGTPPFSYFWYTNGALTTTTTGSSSGTNTYTTPILNTSNSGNSYYCIATNCSSSYSKQSSTAIVSVNPSCITPSNPPNPTSNSPQCGNVTITRSGTVPSNEIWYWQNTSCGTSTSYGSSSTFAAATSGTYYLRSYNTTGGCWSTGCGSVPITIYSPPGFTFTAIPVSCGGCNNGSVTVSPSGGVPGYQYSINGGSWQTSNIFPGLSAGSYTIQVKDINNCLSTTQSATILQPPHINSISLSSHNIVAGGSISFSSSVLYGPTSWTWTFSGGTPYSAISTTSTNPTVVFNNPNSGGYYIVSLQTSNSAGGSNIVTDHFSVQPNTTACIPPGNYVIQQGYNSGHVAEPINIATGSYEYKHTDLTIHAVNGSLNFTRYYNTVNNLLPSALGYGWSHTYDFYVTNQSDTLWTVHYGDGHTSYFIPLINGFGATFPLYGGTYEVLYRDPITSNYTLKFKNGDIYLFNNVGKLVSITDLNGNVTSFNYASGNLTSIIAPGGRSLVFTYSGTNIYTVTDPLGRVVHYSYDGSGNLISVTDPNLHTTGFTYYAQHFIQQITTARGYALLTNSYDGSGRVTSQTDGLSQTTSIAYNTPLVGDATIMYPGGAISVVHHDMYYRLTQQTDELGHSKTFAYDYNNNPDSIVDENGNLTGYTYDNSGNCLNILQPLGISRQFSYNSLNKPTALIDPLTHVSNILYDGNGNAIEVDLPDGSSRHFSYYGNGQIQTSTDGLGHSTIYSYNPFGDLTSIVSPAGTKLFTRDLAGRLTALTDENGHTTTFVYNNTDKIVTITDPLSAIVANSFDADDNLVSVTDKNNHTTTFGYNAKDELIVKINALGRAKSISYDVRDNIKTVTDENGNTVTYGYDQKKRLIAKTNSIGTIQFGYDPVSNVTSLTDAIGNSTSFTYTPLNQRNSAQDPLGRTTQYAYNPLGLLSSVTSPSGRVTSYIYNEIGLVKQVVDPWGHTTFVTYDQNGKKLTLTDANGHTQSFGYNSSSRLTSTRDAENNLDSLIYDGVGNITKELKPTGTITNTYDAVNNLTDVVNSTGDNYHYTYDSVGQILSATNGSGTAHFLYDELNQLMHYTDVFGNSVYYSYDSVGNKTHITYPGGGVVNYQYNADNTLKSVTDWFGNATNYTYDAAGRPIQMQYPNGAICNYAYNVAGDIDSQTTAIGTSIVNKCVPTLNLNGERIFETRIGAVPKHFIQDSFVNSYLQNDVLASDGFSTYGNDGAGNRISESNTSGTTTYSFSVDNILNSIVTPSLTTTFHTDATGNRVERIQGTDDRRYVIDPSGRLVNVLQEQDYTGTLKTSYVYGLGLIARIEPSGTIQYYHFDPQHNTVALSDGTGHVADTYAYLSSGKMVLHNGNTQQPYTFLGEFGGYQETPSFYFLRVRYYDARQSGRFITPDPYRGSLANPQSLNRYTYGLNNPVSLFDPSGFCPENNGSNDISATYPNPWTIKGDIQGVTDNWASGNYGVSILYALSLGKFPILFAIPGGGEIESATLVEGTSEVLTEGTGEVASTGTTLARTLGTEGEDAVGITGPKTRIPSLTGTANYRIPDDLDILEPNTLSEVKNVKELSLTSQIRDFLEYAQETGRKFKLFTRPDTQISAPLQELIDQGKIIHEFIAK